MPARMGFWETWLNPLHLFEASWHPHVRNFSLYRCCQIELTALFIVSVYDIYSKRYFRTSSNFVINPSLLRRLNFFSWISFPFFISTSWLFHVIDARHIPLGVIFFTLGNNKRWNVQLLPLKQLPHCLRKFSLLHLTPGEPPRLSDP